MPYKYLPDSSRLWKELEEVTRCDTDYDEFTNGLPNVTIRFKELYNYGKFTVMHEFRNQNTCTLAMLHCVFGLLQLAVHHFKQLYTIIFKSITTFSLPSSFFRILCGVDLALLYLPNQLLRQRGCSHEHTIVFITRLGQANLWGIGWNSLFVSNYRVWPLKYDRNLLFALDDLVYILSLCSLLFIFLTYFFLFHAFICCCSF